MSSLNIDAFCPVGIGGTKGINTSKLKLFVGGLLQQHTSKDLYDLFIKYGAIRESVVIPDRFRIRSRCYGFVTFESEIAVGKALNNIPIATTEGIKLTVILAAENTKPRRAHFNVSHGISGHKPLPNVYENEIKNNNKNKNESKYAIKKTKINKNESIGIYTDPSLFRTANIQQIAPAKFNIENENINKNNNSYHWPNEDIKKDYKILKKVKVFNDSKYKNNKHWKLISRKNQPINKYFNYKKNNKNNSDDICSIKSREWTPINKNTNKNNNRKNKKSKWTKPHSKSRTHSETVTQSENNANNNQIEKEIELVSEGKLSYNSFAFEEFCDKNNQKEIEELKNMFKNKMQIKINQNNNINYNNNINGLWSPYQPMFTPNTQNYCNFTEYNFQNMVPTPPIQQPINNNNYPNNGYKNYSTNEQMNLYYGYNNNHFCNNSVHSTTREI